MAGKLKRQRTKWTARLWRAVMHHRFPLFPVGRSYFPRDFESVPTLSLSRARQESPRQ